MNIYLPNVHHAERELARLRGIESRLEADIEGLVDPNNSTTKTWISIFTDRLRYNVRPAIKECERYIKSQA